MRKLQWIAVALLFLVAVWGCAETKVPPPKPIAEQNSFDDWRTRAESSPGHSPAASEAQMQPAAESPQAHNQAVTGKPSAKPGRSLPTQNVYLRMHNADTVVVLRALARSVGLNILLNEKVKGAVSVDIEAVPWDKAFIGILHSEGLDYTWEGDMLRVLTAEDMANEAKMASIRPMQIKVVPIHFADPGKLQDKLKDALTKDETGRVSAFIAYDEHTSSLIIKAVPEELDKMVALVESLDRPTPQIHIVGNIVEATKDVTRQLGVQWGGLYHSGQTFITPGGTSGTVNPTTGQVTYTPLTGTSGISGQGFAVNLPAPDISTIGGGSIGLLLGSLGGRGSVLDMQLSALEQVGKVNILSSPSLTTLDNQVAYTQNGQSVPVASLTTTGQASVTYIDAVIKLEITPHVISGNILKLNVVIKKDEPDFSQTVQGNPLIDKKETKTTFICADGETVVISGLSLQSKTVTKTNVPGFANIPLLGALFKSDNKQDQFQDVLIFITPHILKERNDS
ncbi:MAG: secretin N-terminal domain-containing protein [Syntrophobacteraceae bacterium]|jgi:type IV pilus assembly protein PilQ